MTVAANVTTVFGADTNAFDRGLSRVNNGISGMGRNFGSAMSNIRTGADRIGNSLIAMSAPLIAFGTYSLNAAIEFESAFAGVIKTVDGTDEELNALRSTILDMSTDSSNPLAGLDNAAVSIANIMEVAGQLGVPLDSLQEFTQVMGELGLSTNMTAVDAATMAAQFANITGMDFSEVRNFGSTIVALGNNLATTESDIMQFAMRLAGIGNTVGLSEDQILGLSGAMSSVGLNAEAGGTAMTTIFNTMIEDIGKGGDAMETWANISNMSASDFATVWQNEPILALTAFLDGFNKLSAGDQVAALDELGLSGIRVSDTIRRLSANVPLLVDSLALASEAWQQNTALQDEANKRFATTEAQMNLAKNQMQGLGIVVGSVLLPALNDILTDLTPIVIGFTEWAEQNPELVQTVAQLALGALALGIALKGVSLVMGVGGTLLAGARLLVVPLGAIAQLLVGSLVSGFMGLWSSASLAVTSLSGLLGAISPLLLPAMVLGGIVAAYVTDFGGFKTKVNETVSAIKEGDMAGAIQGVADSMLAIPLGLATEIGSWVNLDVPGGLAAWNPVIDGVAGAISSVASSARDATRDLLGMSNAAKEAQNLSNFVDTATTMAGNAGNQSPWGNERRQPVWDPNATRQNAAGGMVPAGGWSWVGENGPELVKFPAQARVFSNPQSNRMGGGNTYNIGSMTIQDPRDAEQLFDMIVQESKRRGA